MFNITTKTERGVTMNINNFDGSMTINDENITVILEEYQTKHFIVDQSTFMLLSAFLVKYLQISVNEKKNRVISMSLTEYMEMRGLKDRKEAKKRAQRDLQAIHRISFSRDEKRQHCSINLSQKTILGRDEIGILLSEPFGELLKESYVIPYPNQLWQLNPHKNPNSFYLLHFIAEHKNMNKRKPNADIIMVSTLLNQAKFIPTLEEVDVLDRNTKARIIKPFERDMNALDETLMWHYQDENGNKVDAVKDYDEFIKLRVCINWRDYPTLETDKKKK